MLAEQHDDWAEGRRYLGLDVLARSRLALINTDDTTDQKEDLTPAAPTAYKYDHRITRWPLHPPRRGLDLTPPTWAR